MLFWFSGEPKKLFENIRKRISKKKTNLKKLKQFSAGRSDELQKTEEELRYSYLDLLKSVNKLKMLS